MRRSVLLLVALAFVQPAFAGITGQVGGNAARLRLSPDTQTMSGESSLFVGIFQVIDGQPNMAAGGWFNGAQWQASGLPVAAFTGRISPQSATIPVPGGVCGLVASNGGKAGSYALFAGWGATHASSGANLDVAEIEREILTAPPEIAARLRSLLDGYRAAQGRMEAMASSDAPAFTNMRARDTWWLIQSFNCGGAL